MQVGQTITARWFPGGAMTPALMGQAGVRPGEESKSHVSASGRITAINGDLITIEGKALVHRNWITE